tara:strand:- start:198 stop:842 length:645 start_codon:yes stop_codon:yes gene_type:complete
MSSKIVVVNSYNKTYEEIKNVTSAHNQQYFDKYNIEYISRRNDLIDDVAINCYDKFEMITSLLHERSDIDYIWSMDVDIVICDFNIDIRVFTKLSKRDILFSSVDECDPNMFWNINAGSIIFKNSPTTRSIMKYYMKIGRETKINDQVLWQIILMRSSKFRSCCGIFPKNAFNHGEKDQFLVHDMSATSTTASSQKAAVVKLESIKRIINEIRR